MASAVSLQNDIRKVCVFRALNLGDMLCAVPALRALRALYPAAEISLVGLPWAAAFQARFHRYLDRFIEFAGYPGLPERPPEPAAMQSFFGEVRQQNFDLALQLHGNGCITNAVVERFGAAMTVGFGSGVASASRVRLWPYPEQGHEIRRNLQLVRLLAAEDLNAPLTEQLEFPLHEHDWTELSRYPALHALRDRRFVCIHPGARDPNKRWLPERFARVADTLAERGYDVAITGSGAERSIAEAVARAMHHDAVIAACDISIGGLAALLSRAALLVSNDTGVAHVATALGRPSVVVFFATDPARWAPLDRDRHRVVFNPAGVAISDVLEGAEALLAMHSA